MTFRFTEKLNRLPDTLALLEGLDTAALELSLRNGHQRHAIAVGSGGSAVSAEFFARCRETLLYRPTLVHTPLEFVLGSADISNHDVWIFSAGADNPDVVAAVHAAICRRPASLHLVTRNPRGIAVRRMAAEGGYVHTVPVADEKDGYLATHSLIATVGALLISAHRITAETPEGDLLPQLSNRVKRILYPSDRGMFHRALKSIGRTDTLIVLRDPQLRTVSALLETSAWETGICTIQCTDFRNFAHGRHAWLQTRSERSFILALTGRDSREAWQSIQSVLPSNQRQLEVDFDDCGRFANSVGVVKGLVLVESIGSSLGIDPGKPSIGQFGSAMYESDALHYIAVRLSPSIRQKRSAMFFHDEPRYSSTSPFDVEQNRLRELGQAIFGGLVLDYDGTLISTEHRYTEPQVDMVQEIGRLHYEGMKLGIATGRGGSAGEDLRSVLEESIHPLVTIGYYNGGYITTLDVDIKKYRPPPDGGIDEAIGWMERRQDLFRKFEKPKRGVQISIQMGDLVDPACFPLQAQECGAVAEGRVRISQSGHSFDLVVTRASKLNVVDAVRNQLDNTAAVLRIGDSGSRYGNDNALLSHPYGISVGDVCDAPDGCWSLFGDYLTGPDAVLRILRAIVLSDKRKFRLDIASLTLDRR